MTTCPASAAQEDALTNVPRSVDAIVCGQHEMTTLDDDPEPLDDAPLAEDADEALDSDFDP